MPRMAIYTILILAAVLALWRPRSKREARIAYLQGRYLQGSAEARCYPRRTARTLRSLAANYNHSYQARVQLRSWANYWATIELDSPYLAG